MSKTYTEWLKQQLLDDYKQKKNLFIPNITLLLKLLTDISFVEIDKM